LVAVQADGHYVNGFDGQGISFLFSKQRKTDRLRTILNGLGVSYSDKLRTNGTWFYIGVEENRDLINRTKHYLGENKQFGSWILDFDRASLDVIVEEVVYWDGLFTRKTEYSSSIRENADWIQIVWLLSGIRARQRLYSPENPNAADHYCVDIPVPYRRRDYTSVKCCETSRVPWDGDVYCLTVPSSYVVVRRGGKVAISGNSKRRERDYKRILGDEYRWKIRSFLTSNIDANYGEPTVLVEADYKGAELYAIAVLARDANMIAHCQRANLPDGDPNQYDIHSNIAVDVFNLRCEPTQAALEAIGQEGLRVGAKNVIFGVNYGRTAEAIARQCKEEGVAISVDQAQTIINGIFNRYPGIPALQERLRARVADPGWIRTYFGRYRRFIPTTDRAAMGELERQALNFPIQSLVADSISTALYYLYNHPCRAELGYKIVLQIHDAILLEVPVRSLDAVCAVMAECMVDRVSFKACNLDGIAYPNSPDYQFGLEVEVAVRWGEKITWQLCDALHIDRKYGIDPAA
jgi:hypothetical protein